MRSSEELRTNLRRIDGKGYKAYKDIEGHYEFGRFSLSVDHVQGDPFASPSRLSVRMPFREADFPADLHSSKVRTIAFGDFLARAFQDEIRQHAKQRRGTGHSGKFQIDCGGQEALERNSILLGENWIEARFTVGLPAAGRRVVARQAEEMLFDELPRIVAGSLRYENCAAAKLREQIETVEDQEHLRSLLEESNLVSFIGNGSVLPRRSGVDDRPMKEADGEVVIPFQSPSDLEVEFECPNRGRIRGMGIPKGVTLIVGGGYHGKSTLLRAIERGVYNHIPGDGREWTVTVSSAVKIRAEDGRFVQKVDISPFIRNLPYGRETTGFSSENASGSTSQAANIIEALEVGAKLLIIDEDTSATNFIIRDARMQALVEKLKEPITPFLDKVRQLLEGHGISTVMVMGGAGDYFDVADYVVMMDQYRAHSVTKKAKQIVLEFPTKRRSEGEDQFGVLRNRFPSATSFDPSRGKRGVKIDVQGLRTILFGTTRINLAALEQLVDTSQTRAIAQAILIFGRKYAAEGLSLREGLRRLESEIETKGLDTLSAYKVGNLARVRVQEIAFAINRLRTLKISGSR
jgi:predicted ABC-class ATPase